MRHLSHILGLLLLVSCLHAEWSIDRLWSRLPPHVFTSRRVHDLSLVMTEKGKKRVEELSRSIPHFDLYFVTVDKIFPEVYAKHKDNTLEYIVNEMLESCLNNETQRDRSFIIFYATDDRKFVWRTGSDARKLVDDQTCLRFSDEIKPHLRNQDFDSGFLEAAKLVRNHLKENHVEVLDDVDSEGIGAMGLLVVVAVAVLFFWCVSRRKKARMDQPLRDEYKKRDETQPIPRNPAQHAHGYPGNAYQPNFGGESQVRYPNLDDEPDQRLHHGGHPTYQPDVPLRHYKTETRHTNFQSSTEGVTSGIGHVVGRLIADQAFNHVVAGRREERREEPVRNEPTKSTTKPKQATETTGKSHDYGATKGTWSANDTKKEKKEAEKDKKSDAKVYGGVSGNWTDVAPADQGVWSRWFSGGQKETTKTSDSFKHNRKESPAKTKPVASGGVTGSW